MAIDSKLLRHVMGKFATGVTMVTTKRGETVSAMTANAVMSLSLDPPLIVISVDRSGSMHGLLEVGGCFAINVLTREQEHLSQRFAQRGEKDLSNLDTDVVETGAPVLRNVLAYADCRIVDVARGGDHDMFIGEMVAGGARDDAQPLLFISGGYRALASE